jgi:hypothetical protein
VRRPLQAITRSRQGTGWSALDPLFVLGLGVAGFLLGYGALRLGADHDPLSKAFASTPAFRLWSGIIGIQSGFWAVTAHSLWRGLRRYQPEWRRHRLHVAAAYVLIAGLMGTGLVLNRTGIDWPLWLHAIRLSILTAVGGLSIGLPALCGILLARYRVQEIASRPASLPQTAKAIFEARADVRSFLLVAGTSVGLATLSIGALHSAVVPRFALESEFPTSDVLGYGAFLTGILLILYLPAHRVITAVARSLRDSAFDIDAMPSSGSGAFSRWLAERRSFEVLVGLDARPLQDVQDAILILAPLLTSVLSLLAGATK